MAGDGTKMFAVAADIELVQNSIWSCTAAITVQSSGWNRYSSDRFVLHYRNKRSAADTATGSRGPLRVPRPDSLCL